MIVANPGKALIPKREFIILCASLFSINSMAIDIMLPALPDMAAELGVASENERQFVISFYLIGFGIAQLILGPLADRFGRKPPLVAGLLLYLVTCVACVFAPDFITLVALRFLQGLGAASTRISVQASIRDRYHSREMAEVMSLIFMVFMAIPVIAPGLGQLILLVASWHMIFIAMGIGTLIVFVWTLLRFDETLTPENRRPLTASAIGEGFIIVLSSRSAFFYNLAATFVMSCLFGFINSAQQIYVDIYGLGDIFPLAFGAVAILMAVSSFLNARFVRRFGQRRLSQGALIAFTSFSGIWLLVALQGTPPFAVFLGLFAAIMFCFGWCSSNMNSLALEPLGRVAGTASSAFGFMQTVTGAIIGLIVGQMFDNTQIPLAASFTLLGTLAFISVLIAEKGRLFTAPGETA
ncbi:multidrug effflux MFS transporter [Rhizobium sp. L1K21]|uniref:multidrug effflux MFS transporter n=1 Tax=Rhizobium sp. L1K21 TaxID=2954933 RepID=UPI0020935F92|nr:multidrug effflux MFS transporter [Rhizobium sp. L1K21]MCO6185882.1 multidrug effflux MFS transporter [Rhizobium sp. L1K21]